ncbi:MAG: 3-deoxy-D-manno-octulosonic acid transferase [Candidatus Aminicenantes bacterium]|nr:MAG: 3-deoxy-D-manno-octulosonic acid transferase [Candidatus Aminicenantes bacterium]
MHFFYSFFLLLYLLIYIPIYYVRIKIFRGDSLYLRERLGLTLPGEKGQEKSLWIHAVSVGEVLSLQNLIKQIKERHPDWVIHFSSLTNTGMKVAQEKLEYADNIFFVPLDFKCIVTRFFSALTPRLFILAESEFWPNLLRAAKKQTKGILLINGRISHHSFKRSHRLRFLIKRVLKNINFFLVQTGKDKERLRKIGVHSDLIEVTGNLKSEVRLPLLPEREIREMKRRLNISEEKKVIVAGSTRKGEEEQLLEAFREARKNKSDLLLILAPRNQNRFDEVEKLCQDFSFKVQRKTSVSSDSEWDILILDTIGELAQSYALSDVSFVGGSLVPWGGQNLLEPAFYRKPVFFGPHMDNFSALAEKFIESNAAKVINKKQDLVEMFLIQDERSLEEMGNRAKEALKSLQGATEKTIKVIEKFMEGP